MMVYDGAGHPCLSALFIYIFLASTVYNCRRDALIMEIRAWDSWLLFLLASSRKLINTHDLECQRFVICLVTVCPDAG